MSWPSCGSIRSWRAGSRTGMRRGQPTFHGFALRRFPAREDARFKSFATDALRSRWGAARGTLREVLGRALACAPAEVQFRYAKHGKPQVAGSTLRFNISHSGALAVIALARFEVGVDVELPRRRRSDAIARRFYAPGEIEGLFAEA